MTFERWVCVPEDGDVCECSWSAKRCSCKRGDDDKCAKCGEPVVAQEVTVDP